MDTAATRLVSTTLRKGVVFQKPDLDTCLTGLILGVTEKDRIIALPSAATPVHLLRDPAILCIEAGGSGQTERNNFDHHDPEHYFQPACRQAYELSGGTDQVLARLVEYVAMVDDGIPPCPLIKGVPQLSHLFSGLLLVTPSIEGRFLLGITFLQTILRLGRDPFAGLSVLPEWQLYLDAWHDNKNRLALAASHKELFNTGLGRVAGFLQHSAIGGSHLLYSAGCDIVILSSSSWGPGRIRKYTIGTRHLQLHGLQAILNRREQGWGGRARIIGSPHQGSRLEPATIKEIITSHF